MRYIDLSVALQNDLPVDRPGNGPHIRYQHHHETFEALAKPFAGLRPEDLPDGTVFDSSIQRGQPAIFRVGDVIKGWQEGLQLMRPGGRARFTIPPELGYGAAGAGGVIPPNSVLVFDVELLGIAPRQQ